MCAWSTGPNRNLLLANLPHPRRSQTRRRCPQKGACCHDAAARDAAPGPPSRQTRLPSRPLSSTHTSRRASASPATSSGPSWPPWSRASACLAWRPPTSRPALIFVWLCFCERKGKQKNSLTTPRPVPSGTNAHTSRLLAVCTCRRFQPIDITSTPGAGTGREGRAHNARPQARAVPQANRWQAATASACRQCGVAAP